MERYQIFHEIITHSDISSPNSVLKSMLDRVNRSFQSERAFYLTIGPGGPRCLVARSISGGDISNPNGCVPWEVIQKVQASRSVYCVKMPLTLKSHGTSSWNRIRINNILAVPSFSENRVASIGYFERKSELPSFQAPEIQTIVGVLQDVEHILNNSRMVQRQTYEIDHLKDEIARGKIKMISQHPAMLRLFKQIIKLAKVPSTVLIQGESGSGKELVARAIFNLSELNGPFISVNCGGIESSLMKSELFGHVKGSFTGALKDRLGLFKKAEGGILFLDEIGDMPNDMQVALLRTLESGEIMPVGADRPILAETRVIAATNRDLGQLVGDRRFRNDLYQRLKGIRLCVPPLRDRRSDIPLLANHFLQKYNRMLTLGFKGFTPQAMELLVSDDYTAGNVRELEHRIERAMVFEDDPDYVGVEHLSEPGDDDQAERPPSECQFEAQMNAFVRKLLREAIEACNGNKTKAMERLGLPRTTFYSMLNKHGIKLNGA